MSWSTREIAELAGTSLRAVRHYHQIGLLAEPERRSNGYKQYGVAHLVRLVRIKRLTDLGFSLPQIAAMGDTDDHPADALRALDDELAAAIERLQRARTELKQILDSAAPTDLPADFVEPNVLANLTDADRSLITVLARVLGPQGLQTYADVLRNAPSGPATTALDVLPAEADESTRQDVAENLVPAVRALYAAHPGLRESRADAPAGARFVDDTVAKAMTELYNAAQLDVLHRIDEIIRTEGAGADSASEHGTTRGGAAAQGGTAQSTSGAKESL